MKPVLETLRSGADYLARRGVEDARLNMEHLLAHVLGCRRLDLYLMFDRTLAEGELQPLRDLLKRRGEGEPLQHLLGTVEFRGQEFISDSRALIPRPETEYLVEILVKRLGAAPPQSILDMGTGSGCIGLSLATAWPQSRFTLVDVSEDALELARLNAHRIHGGSHSIRFFRSDLFEKLGDESFDLIVANLPYIPSAEVRELSREVRQDPMSALDGGASGFEVIERMIRDAARHLKPEGTVALELHFDQAPRARTLLESMGFRDVQEDADLAGIPRFAFAKRPVEGDAPATPSETIPV